MRKQTKLVAVASAAALLAVGASMTSFAATGWVEEDGQWYFYDRDENRVEDTWRKSGDNWYWLDSEEGGAMAIDKLVEDDDDTYYVDSNGVMVRNTWVRVVNEEQDDDTDPAEYNYYYMQSNGKAYKTSSDSTQFRTIDGKRYAFDEDGKMLYGWVNDTHERVDDEDWDDPDTVYYMGSWDDGAMKTGWQKIYVEDHDDDDEEKEFWFYFRSNGKRRQGDFNGDIDERRINGRRYGFDYRGVMTYEWTVVATSSTTGASVSDWKYFNSPEDGARATKGWFKVIAPEEDNDNIFTTYGENYTFAQSDADDEEERWYYADGDGELAVGEIRKIKGKYYGFRPEGGRAAAMLNGLVLMRTDGSTILEVLDGDVDADELEKIIDDNKYVDDGEEIDVPADATLFYFGNDEDNDGAMKTGNVSVNLDGENYNFKFSTSGGAEGRGRGLTGIDDNKYVYKYGLRLRADSDDRFMVVYADGDTASRGAHVAKIDSQDLRDLDSAHRNYAVNRDGDSVSYVGNRNQVWEQGFKLVTTSGTIVKNRTAGRDGADWYFYVDDNRIVMYANTKTLTADSSESAGDTNYERLNNALNNWKDWKDADPDNNGSFKDASNTESFATMNDRDGWLEDHSDWDDSTSEDDNN